MYLNYRNNGKVIINFIVLLYLTVEDDDTNSQGVAEETRDTNIEDIKVSNYVCFFKLLLHFCLFIKLGYYHNDLHFRYFFISIIECYPKHISVSVLFIILLKTKTVKRIYTQLFCKSQDTIL